MLFDLPLEDLRKYVPARTEPQDFDGFWSDTLEKSRRYPLEARFEPYDCGLKLADCFDVTFNGYGGQPIKGWLMLPRASEGRLPCVIEYIGYGGGRGFPLDWLLWSSAGYAHFVMDTRGQGSVWRRGDTPDLSDDGSSPQVPGFMTRGVLDPNTYYYKRLFTDAVRAVQAVRSHPAVDPDHIAVTGGSQGGGISLAVAGLVENIEFAMPDVPFLCHFTRAVEITDSEPYHELVRFCKTHRDKLETVFKTLSYFDGMNFAVRARAEALFSVGLMDTTCPPSTVFAAYNHYAGKKDIRIWKFNEHEGGEQYQALEKLEFLKKHWG